VKLTSYTAAEVAKDFMSLYFSTGGEKRKLEE
jgi:hypothetical protein